jgi:hypothetical protein
MDSVISTAIARELRDAGLAWTPASGDAFQIGLDDFEGDVFTVSDMTIEPHTSPSGTILGFNGTTEWALDSVSIDDALWLPREDQLRELLRGTFRSLQRSLGPDSRFVYTVVASIEGTDAAYASQDPAEAYALAVLALIRSARAE